MRVSATAERGMEMENVVFDMGGVLIKWTPDEVLDNAEVKDEEDRRILKREVFSSQEWAMMDWGVLDEEEAERVFSSRLPSRIHKYLHSILYWDERIGFVEGMDQVLSYLSSQGKGIYLLSNASHRLNEYFPSFPFAHYFKDTVVSADYNRVKPEAELFRLALSKFGIEAKDTLFVDDAPQNVVGGRMIGMEGYLFRRDPENLLSYITGSSSGQGPRH